MLAQVIVDIVHENVAHTFTYTVPPGMKVSLGQRGRGALRPPLQGRYHRLLQRGQRPSPGASASHSPTLEDYPAVLAPSP